jgi:hypothetical protein
MIAPALIAAEFDHALQELLPKFHRLAKADPDRAAQEAMVVQQMLHEYLVMEGVVDA